MAGKKDSPGYLLFAIGHRLLWNEIQETLHEIRCPPASRSTHIIHDGS